jgi:hypothetical protein
MENTTIEQIQEKLFLSIYYNDLETLLQIKKEYPTIYNTKTNFLIDGTTEFNLCHLTHFNLVIWNTISWTDECTPLVTEMRERALQMQTFWKQEGIVEITLPEMAYNKYHEYFYCNDPNEEEEKNELLDSTIEQAVDRGFKEIDFKLYKCAECFDFENVRLLLSKGANPDINFDTPDDSSILARIGFEISYLITCEVYGKFKNFDKKRYNQKLDMLSMFGDLLGLSAHVLMDDLLKK